MRRERLDIVDPANFLPASLPFNAVDRTLAIRCQPAFGRDDHHVAVLTAFETFLLVSRVHRGKGSCGVQGVQLRYAIDRAQGVAGWQVWLGEIIA